MRQRSGRGGDGRSLSGDPEGREMDKGDPEGRKMDKGDPEGREMDKGERTRVGISEKAAEGDRTRKERGRGGPNIRGQSVDNRRGEKSPGLGGRDSRVREFDDRWDSNRDEVEEDQSGLVLSFELGSNWEEIR